MPQSEACEADFTSDQGIALLIVAFLCQSSFPSMGIFNRGTTFLPCRRPQQCSSLSSSSVALLAQSFMSRLHVLSYIITPQSSGVTPLESPLLNAVVCIWCVIKGRRRLQWMSLCFIQSNDDQRSGLRARCTVGRDAYGSLASCILLPSPPNN